MIPQTTNRLSEWNHVLKIPKRHTTDNEMGCECGGDDIEQDPAAARKGADNAQPTYLGKAIAAKTGPNSPQVLASHSAYSHCHLLFNGKCIDRPLFLSASHTAYVCKPTSLDPSLFPRSTAHCQTIFL